MIFSKKQKQQPRLVEEIQEAITVRAHAEDNLKEALDPELVDAAVYELQAADMRLNYLFRLSRREAVG